ncbi:MAG: YbaB/EbfC family nucleoid-associated protein [Treponema sp.]|jgi:DNA-binding YbaB/EbfC family protein|nr:YbaB/EbfC family nucleoid-associated protein [Treponema sp.]
MNINPLELMKNAQKLQEQLSGLQEKLDDVKETGSAGGDMVEVVLNGRMEMLAIRITPELLNPNDRDVLQGLILAAFNNGLDKVRRRVGQEAGGLLGGNLSGLSSFLEN